MQNTCNHTRSGGTIPHPTSSGSRRGAGNLRRNRQDAPSNARHEGRPGYASPGPAAGQAEEQLEGAALEAGLAGLLDDRG
eukprot:scaffold14336_cov63-Phaeocystis_antarctica.AAC.3